MKRSALLFLTWGVFSGCEESSMNDETQESENFTFTSVNVKTEGTDYFDFAANSGVTDEPESWDMAFGTAPVTVEIQPCQYMTIPDPVIMTGEGITMAAVETTSLEEVSEVPASAVFSSDSDSVALIGKSWLAADFSIEQNVYVLKTCSGNSAAFQFSDYTYTGAPLHQLVDITWAYKFDSDGSGDLSSATIDTFVAPGSYNAPTYFAFGSGEVSDSASWDLMIKGYEIWLGDGVTVNTMEDSSLESVNSAPTEDYLSDSLPSYVTSGWYDYGEGHVLTPRDLVYLVNTPDGKFPAFEIMSYYDDDGNSGTFTIEWKYLEQ